MADRVHPSSPPPPRPDHQSVADATATETTPLHQHPSFNRPPSPPPGTYIVQVPKDQVLRVPPPDRARQYEHLSARPARRRRLRRLCFISCSALLLLVLLAAAFVGAVYLVYRPRAPSFSIASLSNIRGLLLDQDPAARSTLSPQITASVRADNGANRKVGVDYRNGGEVAVASSGTRLAAGPWPAFYQPPRNVTVFAASLAWNGVVLTEEQRRRVVAEEAGGAVPLTVEVRVPVRVRFGKVLRTWTVYVKATCEVAVDRLDETAAATNRGCRVRVKPLWWWW